MERLLRSIPDVASLFPPETKSQHNNPNSIAVHPQGNPPTQGKSPGSFQNTGTQNLNGLINNMGHTQGQNNGSFICSGDLNGILSSCSFLNSHPSDVSPQTNAPTQALPGGSYGNSGTRNIKGIINNMGHTQGHDNGSFVSCTKEERQAILSPSAAGLPQGNAPAPNLPAGSFCNTGTESVTGLINNMGYTEGHGNGSLTNITSSKESGVKQNN